VTYLVLHRFVDVGEVRITRSSLGTKRAGERYLIYLPMSRNYLWKVIHEMNAKVRIYIEIPEEVLKKILQSISETG